MPTVLRFIAEWNPISSLTQAVRVLWGNDQPLAAGAAFPMHHPIPFTIGWIILDHRGRGAAGDPHLPRPHRGLSRRPAPRLRSGPGHLGDPCLNDRKH